MGNKGVNFGATPLDTEMSNQKTLGINTFSEIHTGNRLSHNDTNEHKMASSRLLFFVWRLSVTSINI